MSPQNELSTHKEIPFCKFIPYYNKDKILDSFAKQHSNPTLLHASPKHLDYRLLTESLQYLCIKQAPEERACLMHYYAAISIQIFGKQNTKEKLTASFGLPGLIPTVASFRELLKSDRKSLQQPPAKFGMPRSGNINLQEKCLVG